MPLKLSSLPISPPYDSAEDAEGSADPIGTMGGSERLAEVILPGLTARMWRARLLTFAVVAARIADAVVRKQDDQEDLRLRAKLAFERMFVASLVRCEWNDPAKYSGVSRRVPGSQTARRAWKAEDEPLTRQNFIKGQAVNGPSGVMARLARQLGLLDEDGRIANNGQDLHSLWARQATADEEADDDNEGDLHRKALNAVLYHLEDDDWPTRNAPLWHLLADSLRPDRIPAGERKIINQFLHTDPEHGIRPRVLELLLRKGCQAAYRHAAESRDRGRIEHCVLLDGIMPLLGKDPVDEQIAITIQAIDAYEQFSVIFTAAFTSVLSTLLASGGSAAPGRLLQTAKLHTVLKKLHGRLVRLVPTIRDLLPRLACGGSISEQEIPDLMGQTLDDAEHGAASVEALLETIFARHERVQRGKRKPTWVDRSASWTLMPGTPVSESLWHDRPAAFIHPFRVVNAYSLLFDLKLLKGASIYGPDDE